MLVAELFSGPVDVVGDVHGELETLTALLQRLGYDHDGVHPEHRRLVFVGDLTDRGPDSPGVVRLVSRLVRRGRAQVVIGNHELNIMRGDKKDGNAWFFGEREHYENGQPTAEVLADDRTREEVLAFFAELPLALERDDLRVVHACWDPSHVARVRDVREPLVVFSQSEENALKKRLGTSELCRAAQAQADAHRLDDEHNQPPMLRELAQLTTAAQNEHPVKVLTSGKEEPADAPFWAGGRWRLERRASWWDHYEGPMVVVGHYWRSRAPGAFTGKGVDLFAGTEPLAPLGRGHVMCIDYSIGRRCRERALGQPRKSALGAYRWPERQVVFAD